MQNEQPGHKLSKGTGFCSSLLGEPLPELPVMGGPCRQGALRGDSDIFRSSPASERLASARSLPSVQKLGQPPCTKSLVQSLAAFEIQHSVAQSFSFLHRKSSKVFARKLSAESFPLSAGRSPGASFPEVYDLDCEDFVFLKKRPPFIEIIEIPEKILSFSCDLDFLEEPCKQEPVPSVTHDDFDLFLLNLPEKDLNPEALSSKKNRLFIRSGITGFVSRISFCSFESPDCESGILGSQESRNPDLSEEEKTAKARGHCESAEIISASSLQKNRHIIRWRGATLFAALFVGCLFLFVFSGPTVRHPPVLLEVSKEPFRVRPDNFSHARTESFGNRVYQVFSRTLSRGAPSHKQPLITQEEPIIGIAAFYSNERNGAMQSFCKRFLIDQKKNLQESYLISSAFFPERCMAYALPARKVQTQLIAQKKPLMAF